MVTSATISGGLLWMTGALGVLVAGILTVYPIGGIGIDEWNSLTGMNLPETTPELRDAAGTAAESGIVNAAESGIVNAAMPEVGSGVM